MSETRDCCACGGTTLIFACSGSSNVGQITNSLALRLAREGAGAMSCLAGVVPARDCDRLVVLDGCEHRCAFKTLEHVQAKPHVYVNFTEHGFVKKHGVLADDTEIERDHAIVTALLGEASCSTAS